MNEAEIYLDTSLIERAIYEIKPVLEDLRTSILSAYPRGIVYLSGGIEYTDDYKSWRSLIKEELKDRDIYAIDIGLIDTKYQEKHGEFDVPFWHTDVKTEKDWLLKKTYILNHIIITDLILVELADGLIVLYDESVKKGAGTIGECQFVGEKMKPVFIMSKFKYEDIPLWLQGLSTKIFFSWKEMLDFIDENNINFTKINSFYGREISKEEYVELAELIYDQFSNLERLKIGLETIVEDLKEE